MHPIKLFAEDCGPSKRDTAGGGALLEEELILLVHVWMAAAHDIFLFRQRFSHFRHKRRFFARPPLFFASLDVLFSDRAGASRHLDFDEQSRDSASRDQSRTVQMYNSPGKCRDTAQ